MAVDPGKAWGIVIRPRAPYWLHPLLISNPRHYLCKTKEFYRIKSFLKAIFSHKIKA